MTSLLIDGPSADARVVFRDSLGSTQLFLLLRKSAVKEDYDKKFYNKYGWVSCFECDLIFTDLKKLADHQEKHLIEEKCLNMTEK